MFRTFLAALVALALTACGATLPPVSTTPPAPLANTTIDDTALEATWRSFDLALDAINLMPIQPGSAKGKAVASGIRRVLAALTAAENAAAALSSTNYLSALAEVKAAIASLRTALKSPSADAGGTGDDLNLAIAEARTALANRRS